MTVSPALPASQLAKLASVGDERTAAVGDVLYRIGDERYPFVAILAGEAAGLGSAGEGLVRHGAAGTSSTGAATSPTRSSRSSGARRRCSTARGTRSSGTARRGSWVSST